jgi:hypothetical protein
VKPARGNKNPVTLVKIVIARKGAVQPLILCELNMPYKTMRPDMIPIRLITLITTCSSVKLSIDMPRIMGRIVRVSGYI